MRIGVSAAAADQLFDALDVEKIGSLVVNVCEGEEDENNQMVALEICE